MSDAVLLDTHIALWLDAGSDRLKPSTRKRIDDCWRDGGSIYLSAISVWEIALLVDSGRIALDLSVEAWVERFLARPGVAAVPLDHYAAARAYELHSFRHRDPADRLLVAAAIGIRCPFVTYDRRITRFAKAHGRRHGFAAVG